MYSAQKRGAGLRYGLDRGVAGGRQGASAEHVIKSFLATETVKLTPSTLKLGFHSPGFIYLCCMVQVLVMIHVRSRTLAHSAGVMRPRSGLTSQPVA